MLANTDYALESLLLELLGAGKEASILAETDEIDQDEISEKEYYDIYLAALRVITRQLDLGSEALHSLINQHFPLISPWCPVYVPPPAAGTYWLAPAYAPAAHVKAHWRPVRGVPWGRWQAPGTRGPVALQPGDRWRNL